MIKDCIQLPYTWKNNHHNIANSSLVDNSENHLCQFSSQSGKIERLSNSNTGIRVQDSVSLSHPKKKRKPLNVCW